ncbi:MAG: hypothetical protein O7H41_18185 [Planctomycetota bacterium]|nr:hypothetical protein [Planctomycetota bacterium]
MSKSATTSQKFRFLILLKGEEQYFFKYESGNELSLCYTLIDYALDSRFNLVLPEILDLISKEIYTKSHAVYKFPA